jgi:hypothetical protein
MINKKWIVIISLFLLIGTASATTQLFFLPINASEPVPNIKQSADIINRDVAGNKASYANPGVMSATVSSVQGISTTSATTANEPGATHYTHYGSWASNPLAEQWVNGTVTIGLVMREGANQQNANPRLKIYKWFANDTYGGELRTIGNSATEIPAAYPSNPVVYFNAVALTSTYFEEGDRIVIELETYDNNAVTTSWIHGIRYGSISGGYLSYATFSADLTYAPRNTVVNWTGTRDISELLNSSVWKSATLATETKKVLDTTTFPYEITQSLTTTTIEKFRCTAEMCGYWIHSYRDGQEIATNSPIWISPPPFEAVVSDTDDTIKNEENVVLKEDPKSALEQVLQGYVDRQPTGKAVVGTKE